jgi:hypothetical protein
VLNALDLLEKKVVYFYEGAKEWKRNTQ